MWRTDRKELLGWLKDPVTSLPKMYWNFEFNQCGSTKLKCIFNFSPSQGLPQKKHDLPLAQAEGLLFSTCACAMLGGHCHTCLAPARPHPQSIPKTILGKINR